MILYFFSSLCTAPETVQGIYRERFLIGDNNNLLFSTISRNVRTGAISIYSSISFSERYNVSGLAWLLGVQQKIAFLMIGEDVASYKVKDY